MYRVLFSQGISHEISLARNFCALPEGEKRSYTVEANSRHEAIRIALSQEMNYCGGFTVSPTGK